MCLIENKDIRKAFKTWALTLGIPIERLSFKYDAERVKFECYIADSSIEFASKDGIKCQDRGEYTYNELCEGKE